MQLSDQAAFDKVQKEKELLSIRKLISIYFQFTTSIETNECLKQHPIRAEKEEPKAEQFTVDETQIEASDSKIEVLKPSEKESKESIDQEDVIFAVIYIQESI